MPKPEPLDIHSDHLDHVDRTNLENVLTATGGLVAACGMLPRHRNISIAITHIETAQLWLRDRLERAEYSEHAPADQTGFEASNDGGGD